MLRHVPEHATREGRTTACTPRAGNFQMSPKPLHHDHRVQRATVARLTATKVAVLSVRPTQQEARRQPRRRRGGASRRDITPPRDRLTRGPRRRRSRLRRPKRTAASSTHTRRDIVTELKLCSHSSSQDPPCCPPCTACQHSSARAAQIPLLFLHIARRMARPAAGAALEWNRQERCGVWQRLRLR
jgi:hypothetical protein